MRNTVLQKARGKILTELPADLGSAVSSIIVAYSVLERRLSELSAVTLQLNKTEARIALRMPRATERLDMALDLLAIKGIDPEADETSLRAVIDEATSARDLIAHGLWIKHPTDSRIFVERTRGTWTREYMGGSRIKRSIFPEGMPYGLEEAAQGLATVRRAIEATEALGARIDQATDTYPDKFRLPLRVANPLGRRAKRDKKPQL